MGSQRAAQTIAMQMEIKNLPKINRNDPDQVKERVNEYFKIMQKYDSKPTQGGLALALGCDRSTMHNMASNINGKYAEDVSEEIKQVFVLFESLWETYMVEGDIPSLNGIFIGKNQFGYKDTVEHDVVTEVKPKLDVESIKMKYIGADNELPEDHTKGDEE